MLCVVIEDTVRVIGERQLSALSTLAAELAGTISEQDVFSAIERGVTGQKDMPCTLTYLFDEDGKQLKLAAKTGFESDHPAACRIISVDSKAAPWPIHSLLAANRAVTIEDLAAYFLICLPAAGTSRRPAHDWSQSPARGRKSRWESSLPR
jgi:hypothetical protein